MGYLSVLLQAEHQRRVYWSPAWAAAGRRPGDYRRAGGDVYGKSLRRHLPRRAAHPGGWKRLLCAAADGGEHRRDGAAVHRGRRCRTVAAAAAEYRRAAADGHRAYRGFPADDYPAADCLPAAAVHHSGAAQRQSPAKPFSRRGVGLWLRPRTVNGDYRARFCDAGETSLCPGTQTA